MVVSCRGAAKQLLALRILINGKSSRMESGRQLFSRASSRNGVPCCAVFRAAFSQRTLVAEFLLGDLAVLVHICRDVPVKLFVCK